MWVVDASVAVKWLVPEESRHEASTLITEAGPLLAPDLIITEVSSALSRKARLGQITAAEAKGAHSVWMEALQCGVLTLSSSMDLLEESFQLSLTLDHALPDCLYLALARRVSGVLVTADARLAKKASEVEGLKVRLLGQA
ncbi:MAG: type II toxin-antitoxin system VapC family toxin [Bryobacteraceae bacterium]